MKSLCLIAFLSLILAGCCGGLLAQEAYPYDDRQQEAWAEVDEWVSQTDLSEEQLEGIARLRELGTVIRINENQIVKVTPLGGYDCSVLTLTSKDKVVERSLLDNSKPSRWDGNHSALEILGLFSSVGRLSLLSLKLDSEEWKLVGGLKSVESLEVRLPEDSPLVLSDAIESIAGLEQLKTLKIQAEVVEFEVDALNPFSSLTKLQSFSLDCDQVKAAHFDFLKSTTSLSGLNLSSPLIDDQLAGQIEKLTELEKLNLSGTAVGNATVEALGAMKKLESLDLSGTKITDACLSSIRMPELSDRSPVGSLKFTDTSITAAGVKTIPRATIQNSFLLSLPEVKREDVLPIFLIQPKLHVTYIEKFSDGKVELTNSNILVPTKEELAALKARKPQ